MTTPNFQEPTFLSPETGPNFGHFLNEQKDSAAQTTSFTEVYDHDELEKAMKSGASVVFFEGMKPLNDELVINGKVIESRPSSQFFIYYCEVAVAEGNLAQKMLFELEAYVDKINTGRKQDYKNNPEKLQLVTVKCTEKPYGTVLEVDRMNYKAMDYFLRRFFSQSDSGNGLH